MAGLPGAVALIESAPLRDIAEPEGSHRLGGRQG